MPELLSDRRKEIVLNLMAEFNISRRTVQLVIIHSLCFAPVYTVQGNGGSVYIADGYYYGRRYLYSNQEELLRRLMPGLQPEDQKTMQNILSSFGMPKPPASPGIKRSRA